MSVPVPLGPGDADVRASDRGEAAPVAGPLGPGESEPGAAIAEMAVPLAPLGLGEADEKDRGVALPVMPPLSAGESDGKDRGTAAVVQPPFAPGDGEESEWEMRPPRLLGPGDLQVPQHAVRVRRKGV